MEQKYLKSILSYDRKTGVFVWKKKIAKKVVVGKVAGGVGAGGYWVIGIGGVIYYGHRLAWLYVYGEWPDMTDHKDGDIINNAISNLRECTSSQNAFNSKIHKHNTSGMKGVSWHKSASKWSAQMVYNGGQIHLGLFDTPELAADAYLLAVGKLEPDYVREK